MKKQKNPSRVGTRQKVKAVRAPKKPSRKPKESLNTEQAADDDLRAAAGDFGGLYGLTALLDVMLGALNCGLVAKGIFRKSELRELYSAAIARAVVREGSRIVHDCFGTPAQEAKA